MSTRDPQPAAAAPRKERTALYTIARGLAWLPLLPVYIDGKLKLFHTTDVYVGDPMDISDLSNQGYDAEVVHALTERIRQTFLTMREDVRQGRLK